MATQLFNDKVGIQIHATLDNVDRWSRDYDFSEAYAHEESVQYRFTDNSGYTHGLVVRRREEAFALIEANQKYRKLIKEYQPMTD